eukprot:3472258-Prymnesium_polylepis.1
MPVGIGPSDCARQWLSTWPSPPSPPPPPPPSVRLPSASSAPQRRAPARRSPLTRASTSRRRPRWPGWRSTPLTCARRRCRTR